MFRTNYTDNLTVILCMKISFDAYVSNVEMYSENMYHNSFSHNTYSAHIRSQDRYPYVPLFKDPITKMELSRWQVSKKLSDAFFPLFKSGTSHVKISVNAQRWSKERRTVKIVFRWTFKKYTVDTGMCRQNVPTAKCLC